MVRAPSLHAVETQLGNVGRAWILCLLTACTSLAADNQPNAIQWEQHASIVEITGNIIAIGFSPDGRILASGGTYYPAPGEEFYTVRLWNASDGTFLADLGEHPREINDVTFSPDGKLVATGGDDGTVTLWDFEKRSARGTLENPGRANEVVFAPDGKTLITSGDGAIALWNVADGKLIATLSQDGMVTGLALSPQGDQLATSSRDKTGADVIVLWNLTERRIIRVLAGHTSVVDSLAFSPDGKRLASGSWDETVRVWNIETGAQVKVLEPVLGPIFSVAFSPDGKLLAAGNWSHPARVWTTDQWSETQLPGGTGRSVAFSPDGRFLASTGAPRRMPRLAPLAEVKIWRRSGE